MKSTDAEADLLVRTVQVPHDKNDVRIENLCNL